MDDTGFNKDIKLSVVVPCYNEEETLAKCVRRLLAIQDRELSVQIIIVDDGSRDDSLSIANSLAGNHSEIAVLAHEVNRGKGAALRSGFARATGDFVAVQDADLEYNPEDLKDLLVPLVNGDADVVFGSRFGGQGARRVLYFWHSLGNKFLTLLSNMFTDLNLTDMETCYKVFRREVIQSISLEEDRFGFEPEIVAKIAHMNLRIYEAGISYRGRTYEEGKKIGVRDGLRALYCIFRYNAHRLPLPLKFLVYLFIGGTAALVNLATFLSLLSLGLSPIPAAAAAFAGAAVVNYLLCIVILFRHNAFWNTPMELAAYILVTGVAGVFDITSTTILLKLAYAPWLAKSIACAAGVLINFFGRSHVVFPESARKASRRKAVASNEAAEDAKSSVAHKELQSCRRASEDVLG